MFTKLKLFFILSGAIFLILPLQAHSCSKDKEIDLKVTTSLININVESVKEIFKKIPCEQYNLENIQLTIWSFLDLLKQAKPESKDTEVNLSRSQITALSRLASTDVDHKAAFRVLSFGLNIFEDLDFAIKIGEESKKNPDLVARKAALAYEKLRAIDKETALQYSLEFGMEKASYSDFVGSMEFGLSIEISMAIARTAQRNQSTFFLPNITSTIRHMGVEPNELTLDDVKGIITMGDLDYQALRRALDEGVNIYYAEKLVRSYEDPDKDFNYDLALATMVQFKNANFLNETTTTQAIEFGYHHKGDFNIEGIEVFVDALRHKFATHLAIKIAKLKLDNDDYNFKQSVFMFDKMEASRDEINIRSIIAIHYGLNSHFLGGNYMDTFIDAYFFLVKHYEIEADTALETLFNLSRCSLHFDRSRKKDFDISYHLFSKILEREAKLNRKPLIASKLKNILYQYRIEASSTLSLSYSLINCHEYGITPYNYNGFSTINFQTEGLEAIKE